MQRVVVVVVLGAGDELLQGVLAVFREYEELVETDGLGVSVGHGQEVEGQEGSGGEAANVEFRGIFHGGLQLRTRLGHIT